MEGKRRLGKRPCRICGRWFRPDPRLGERQKTCGRWNRQNRSYFKEIYLRRRLERSAGGSPSRYLASRSLPLDFPGEVIQEVMGRQPAVIIEYLLRLLIREVQEVINAQHTDIHRGFRRLPPSSISRGDSQRSP